MLLKVEIVKNDYVVPDTTFNLAITDDKSIAELITMLNNMLILKDDEHVRFSIMK